MRYWILVLLPVMLFLGCNKKVTGPGSTDNGNQPPPTSSIPKAPGNLHALTFVGRGIGVWWADSSNNERWFVLSHGLVGQLPGYDTLPANTYFHFDSVTFTEGMYNYRVRAGNDSGWSAWTSWLTVNYRLASDGLIPLRVGNFWEYNVDSAGLHHNYRRSVRELRLVGGADYYLLSDSLMAAGATPEARFYLRNCDESTTLLRFPLDSALQTDTLFRYPHTHSGDHYNFEQDSIEVLNPPGLGTVLQHVGPGDSTYSGVVSFQRFLNHDSRNSIQYFMVPNRIGIIREDEYVNSSLVARRDIVNYRVLN